MSVTIGSRNQRWNDERDDQLRKLCRTDMFYQEISAVMGISVGSIKHRAQFLKIPRREAAMRRGGPLSNTATRDLTPIWAEPDRVFDEPLVAKLRAAGGHATYSERELKAAGSKRYFAVCLPVRWPVLEERG